MQRQSFNRRARSSSISLAVIAVAAAFGPAITASPPAAKFHSAAEDLAPAVDAYNLATIRNDTRALSALVTDDYRLVNSNSSVQDKASYLGDFNLPGFRIEPYEVEGPFSRIHGDAALTGGTIQLRWAQGGRRQNRRLRVAHFWVRQHGRWRIAHTQLTRVPGMIE